MPKLYNTWENYSDRTDLFGMNRRFLWCVKKQKGKQNKCFCSLLISFKRLFTLVYEDASSQTRRSKHNWAIVRSNLNRNFLIVNFYSCGKMASLCGTCES